LVNKLEYLSITHPTVA